MLKNKEDVLQRIEEYKASFILKGLEPITNYYRFEVSEQGNVYMHTIVKYDDSIPYKELIIPKFVDVMTTPYYVPHGEVQKIIFMGDIEIKEGVFHHFLNLKTIVFKGNAILDGSVFAYSNVDEIQFKGKKVYIGDDVFSNAGGNLLLKFYNNGINLEGYESLVGCMTLDFSEATPGLFSVSKRLMVDFESILIILSDSNIGLILDEFAKKDEYVIQRVGYNKFLIERQEVLL